MPDDLLLPPDVEAMRLVETLPGRTARELIAFLSAEHEPERDAPVPDSDLYVDGFPDRAL